MAVHCLRMLPKQTDKDIMDRKDSIKFKLIPEGHIRGVQTQRSDLASAAELQIYPPPFMQSNNNRGALPENLDNR